MKSLRLAGEKIATLHELIRQLYDQPFDDALVLDVAPKACALVDSQYFSLYLLPSGRAHGRPVIISNNPPEYIPIYLSVKREDYIVESLVETNRVRVLTRLPEYDGPSHRNFNETVLAARPISDLIYVPVKIGGAIRGHWSIARAGAASPVYSDEEIEAFLFLSDFLNDAFQRSLMPSPLEEDLAYLDYRGHTLAGGARIRAAFDELFGSKLRATGEQCARMESFQARFRRFLHGSLTVGMDKVELLSGAGRHVLAFKLLRTADSLLRLDDFPFASVRLLSTSSIQGPRPTISPIALPLRYQFTPRELEVLRGIYAGKSNKVIAASLGIDEGTVKRYTHGIYEKTGFRSRVELVLGLSVG